MDERRSRRDFLKTTGSGAVLATLGAGVACTRSPEQPVPGEKKERQEVSRAVIESEIRRRADFYLSQRCLVVDYYRIRRKLAYSLPVEDLSIPEVEVPSISDYPWSIWMTWELEQRVNSLGWAAEWFGDQRAQTAAAGDLEALAKWPKYRQYEGPDLSSGHAGRILWTALMKWTWLDDQLRNLLVDGCRRHCQEVSPQSQQAYGHLKSVADILALEQPHRKLHNIALIGTISAALTGSCAGDAEVASLNDSIHTVFEANLDFRKDGFTEGVAYDGYVLDFIADWLEILPDEQRSSLLDHRFLQDFLDESYLLSAPGAAENVAELGDVEPKEMPFHISAQAKLYRFQPDPVRGWLLGRWRVDWIRSGGLGALHPIADDLQKTPPPDGTGNAHYAVSLRNGWDQTGLAAVVSCTNSPMGHLQRDNGTLLVGAAGRWLVTDPGYQQYMDDQEREFTLGPTAHNYPVLNGLVQSRKEPRLQVLKSTDGKSHMTTVDITSCYPPDVGAESVIRTVWLSERDLVVVADRIEAGALESLQYHWHGDPQASWWCENGWARIHTSEADLWITSPQFTIAGGHIKRLAGSRGQLTLSVQSGPSDPVVWWVFVLGERPRPFQLSNEGARLVIEGRTFQV